MAKRNRAPDRIETDALAMALTPVAAALIRAEQSAGNLLQAAKRAFLSAAIEEVRSRKERPSVSRLSVITGMTRKEVSSLLKADQASGSKAHPPKQMEHRALRVVRGWKMDPRYSTAAHPRDLRVTGGVGSFATLVSAYGGDVPAVAVRRELERMKAIRITKTGKLRLKPRSASSSSALSGRLDEFARLLADFSGTAAQLLSESQPEIYFGFKELSGMEERQIARFKASFGRRAAALLEGVEHWIPASDPRRRSRSNANDARRVGLGVYLVDRETVGRSSGNKKS